MKKYKGKQIYLTAKEQSLIDSALDEYSKKLMALYDDKCKREEEQLNTCLDIRDLQESKF